MPEWLRLVLQYGTLLLFVAIFLGMIAWLFGGGPRPPRGGARP